jgi:hypothetical protein
MVNTQKGKHHRFKLGSVLAVGGVQVLDFISDVAVVAQWYLQGESMLANISIGFLAVAVIVAVIGSWFYFFDYWGPRSGWPLAIRVFLFLLVPPLNLHVLFAGFTMNRDNLNERGCFYVGKGYETIYESVPMSVLTVYYIVTVDPMLQRESTALIMVPSLILSCLSIAYGMTATAINENGMTGLPTGLLVFSFFMLDTFWIISGCWGIFAIGQYMVLLYVAAVQVAFLLRMYVKKSRVVKSTGWNWLGQFVFYFTLFLPCTLFDASPRLAWLNIPGAHFVELPSVIARRICLLVMSIVTLVTIQAPVWMWVIFVLAVCLHSYMCFRIYLLDDICFQRISAFFDRLPIPRYLSPRIGPEAGSQEDIFLTEGSSLECYGREGDKRAMVASSRVLSTNIVLMSTRPAVKVHKCLQDLVQHDAWSEERVKRFVDVAEGVLRAGTIKACSSTVNAVEDLVSLTAKDIQEHYPDLFLSTLMDISFRILFSYEPHEKHNKLLRSRVTSVLEQQGIVVRYPEPDVVDDVNHEYESPSLKDAHSLQQHTLAQNQHTLGPSLLQQHTLGLQQHTLGPSLLQQHTLGPSLLQQHTLDPSHREEHTLAAFNELCIGHQVSPLEPTANPTVNMRALPLVHAANIWLWKSASGRPEQYVLSKPVDECATFISHSWSDHCKLYRYMHTDTENL